MNTLPIILDTDIGDDIDDALALAVILNSPELELLGVTTVFRNAPRRAILAQQILKLYRRTDVPVAAGISNPLLVPNDGQLGEQFKVLEEDNIADTLEEPIGHAVDFLVSQMQNDKWTPENPLLIAPIGPLTNIAVALARESELIARARLVLMGGYWNEKLAYDEWNIKCDPEAAAMVFHSGIQIDMVGLDVTLQCKLSSQQIERIAAKQPLLGRLMQKWTQNGAPITLHDPLAILTLLDESVVKWEEKRIAVQLCGDKRAHTVVVEGEANCRVAVSVDAERATNAIEAILLR